MDSFNPISSSSSSSFSPYTDSSPDPHSHESIPFSAMLDIYVHQARNIHNICIYANQDVYAKFSLTCSPDDTLSTQIIKGGGRNPDFNELLHLPIPHRDAVLKCEIWMLSRARNYLDDQLLGFTLVPLSLLPLSHHPHPKLTQDFTLSSTDLFHSPAGTVQLTLSLDTSCSHPSCNSSSVLSFQDSGNSTSTITSEVVLLNPDEYKRIEFPDIGVAKENQLMVSEYFSIAPPFLHLASSSSSSPPPSQSLDDDYDMTKNGAAAAAAGTDQESFQHSAATSLSDDRKSQEESNNGNEEDDEHDKECGKQENEELGSVFKSPLGNINFEEEQSVMQQQIVDMYMRSMQQFTESLAKMKLPMDIDNPNVGEDGADVIQREDKSKLEAINNNKKKKDGSRVFYGSRAFF